MCFALDGRSEASAGMGTSSNRQHMLAVTCRTEGRLSSVEVHVLTDTCAAAVPDEAAKLAHFLKRL